MHTRHSARHTRRMKRTTHTRRTRHTTRHTARHTARHTEQTARHARTHRDRQFLPVQWVFAWRRASTAIRSHNLQRDRWTGPGAVVWHHGTTVGVAMQCLYQHWHSFGRANNPSVGATQLGLHIGLLNVGLLTRVSLKAGVTVTELANGH